MSDTRRRRHWTRGIVVFWLIAAALGMIAQAVLAGDYGMFGYAAADPIKLPLANLVVFTGFVTAAYIGIEQGSNIVESLKLPSGMGITPPTRKYLWITIAWLVLVLEGLIVQLTVPPDIAMPVTELVSYAGLVSAVYVGGNKMHRVATKAGENGRGERAAPVGGVGS